MAEVTYVPTKEGDAFSASELNQTFDGVAVALNEVPNYAKPEGALRHEHFGVDIVPPESSYTVSFNSVVDTTNIYPTHDNDTVNAGPGAVAWEILSPLTQLTGLNGGPGYALGDPTTKIQGVLLMANIALASIVEASSGNKVKYQAVFALQIGLDLSGVLTWFTVPQTERFVSQGTLYNVAGEDICDIDVPIRHLINSSSDDILNTRPMMGARIIYSTLNLTDPFDGNTLTVAVQRANLSVIPLHCLKS